MAAPEGAAKFREETPRKGWQHKRQEVPYAALQQYGPLARLRQVQILGKFRKKPAFLRHFARKSGSASRNAILVRCNIALSASVTSLSCGRNKRFARRSY